VVARFVLLTGDDALGMDGEHQSSIGGAQKNLGERTASLIVLLHTEAV
jgi:hypothetical protein